MLWEFITKSSFSLSYIYKSFALRFFGSDSVDNIFGNTGDKTIDFECLNMFFASDSVDNNFYRFFASDSVDNILIGFLQAIL